MGEGMVKNIEEEEELEAQAEGLDRGQTRNR